MNPPVTISEWAAYIAALSREELFNQCRAANTFKFAQTMLTEGMEMASLEQVMKLFARALVRAEIKLPEGGAFPLLSLTEVDALSGF